MGALTAVLLHKVLKCKTYAGRVKARENCLSLWRQLIMPLISFALAIVYT